MAIFKGIKGGDVAAPVARDRIWACQVSAD
jgi:hypothetical protein